MTFCAQSCSGGYLSIHATSRFGAYIDGVPSLDFSNKFRKQILLLKSLFPKTDQFQPLSQFIWVDTMSSRNRSFQLTQPQHLLSTLKLTVESDASPSIVYVSSSTITIVRKSIIGTIMKMSVTVHRDRINQNLWSADDISNA